MMFDDCASIVYEWRGTDDDSMDFSYKRIFVTRFLSENNRRIYVL
nr:MAG TPA: hypothetical protein [Bacteriophage sp.]